MMGLYSFSISIAFEYLTMPSCFLRLTVVPTITSKAGERTSYALDMLLQLPNAARIYVLSTYWGGKQRRRPCFGDCAMLRQSST